MTTGAGTLVSGAGRVKSRGSDQGREVCPPGRRGLPHPANARSEGSCQVL